MSDLFCLHCGADEDHHTLGADGECAECGLFSLQRSAAQYAGMPLTTGCDHCGCYWHNREDCCGCGANLNDASR